MYLFIWYCVWILLHIYRLMASYVYVLTMYLYYIIICTLMLNTIHTSYLRWTEDKAYTDYNIEIWSLRQGSKTAVGVGGPYGCIPWVLLSVLPAMIKIVIHWPYISGPSPPLSIHRTSKLAFQALSVSVWRLRHGSVCSGYDATLEECPYEAMHL